MNKTHFKVIKRYVFIGKYYGNYFHPEIGLLTLLSFWTFVLSIIAYWIFLFIFSIKIELLQLIFAISFLLWLIFSSSEHSISQEHIYRKSGQYIGPHTNQG